MDSSHIMVLQVGEIEPAEAAREEGMKTMYQDKCPNRRAFFLSTVTMIGGFIVSGLLSGCGGSDSTATNNPNAPLVAQRQYGALQFTLSTTRSTFARGEEIPFIFTIFNTGTEPIVYGNGVQKYKALVFQGNTPIWDSDYGSGFVADSMNTLASGESRRYEFTWSQKNSRFMGAPEIQVAPGTYRVTVFANMILNGATDPMTATQLSAGPMDITIR